MVKSTVRRSGTTFCPDCSTMIWLFRNASVSDTDLSVVETEFAQTSNCASVHILRSRRPVGPVANPNKKDGHPVFGVIRRDSW